MMPVLLPRPDEDLAREAALGGREAFEALVRRHTAPLLAFCRRIARDPSEAEDRVQETFLKAYRRLASFDPRRSFTSWLYKIAQNACIDGLRAADPPLPASPLPRPLKSAAEGRLDAAIDALPAKHQAVLHYKYRLGYTASQIAEQLGLSHEDVRVSLHRAIRTLRERLS